MLITVAQLAFLYGVVSIAVAFAFRVIGFPDLTPDGTFVLAAAIAAVLIRGGHSWVTALVAGSLAGGLAGIATALLHTRLRVSRLLSGILVTLALYSISLRVMSSPNLSLLNVDTLPTRLTRASTASAFFVTATVCAGAYVLAVALLRTRSGIRLRAMGDSETALEVRGVSRQPYYIMGLAFANAMVGAAGVIIALFQGFVDVSMGAGLVVTSLAAVVMGETMIRPENVSTLILAPVAGMFIYQLVVAMALRTGFSPADLRISTAVLAIAFIGLDRLRIQRGNAGRQIGNRAV